MKIHKALIISLLFGTFSDANIPNRYPSYPLVFTELSVNHNYINNPNFKYFVQKNDQKYRKIYQQSMQRAQLIVPTIKDKLIENGLSPIFLYLSLVESSFKVDARSRSNAIGLWQFKRAAGQDQKLVMTNEVDERYDPIRATEAAIGYLTTQNQGFDKWYLAAMSYNWGKTNVKRAIQKAGTTDLHVLLDPQRNLVRKETRDYINKILLFAMIGENHLLSPYDHTGANVPTSSDDKLVKVKVRNGEHLNAIASAIQMNPITLRQNNLHFRQGYVPNQRFSVNIPESKLQQFHQNYRSF